ncbi:MAG: sigma-70 family RNA polymerase sigma factor [Oscillibacter sp.]|nr:sigma-70 family RNA polymerase sigma factor [Oscillibacter sp.]
MKLSPAQQKTVEENMGLVGKVIKDKVHGLNQSGIYSYEDLIQIGYIGLCKAAYTDKGGCFSTYAYRLIWNEICDALIKVNCQYSREISLEDTNEIEAEYLEPVIFGELSAVLDIVTKRATPAVQNGIKALRYASNGYSSREIGIAMNASDGKVRMWMTRAKRFLQTQPEILALTEI